MNNILIFVLILVAGVILGILWGAWKRNPKSPKMIGQENLIYGQIKIKHENKERILEFLKNNEKIVNNDIQKLLGVSDATATRYLDELEEENKIKQIGKTGNAVYYQLV